ncbi:UNVERIFIED_CONTAM: hypothetical protein Q9R58_22245 [Methylobacteriaceae bacterium AG10]|nr:hypothetical protein [Methylobacteriaceae bacterium AG10]
MAQDLTTRSAAALPAIDTADPASMLLLPEWLAQQIAAVSDLGAGRTEVDPVTRQITARVATIPASRMPTGPQRTAIARRIAELRDATEAGPVEETLGAIGDLIQEYAPSRLDERTAGIKVEAYMDAVEDLPAWTIRAAIRRWRRGEVSADPATLDFAPKPARLRSIAERMALVARGQAARLQRVLDAKPEVQITDAQMAENSEKLSGLIAKTAVGPVIEPAGAISAERRAALADLEERKKRREAAEREGSPARELAP